VRILAVFNAKAGTLAGLSVDEVGRQVRDAFTRAGHHLEVIAPDPHDFPACVQRTIAEKFDVVLAGGGDGTINSLANLLAGSDVALGVLPLGTHNHFARELGIPLTLEAALQALVIGSVNTMHVAEVNGRVFLNFSGIGFHPNVVKYRDAQREAVGRSKPWAMVISLVRNVVRLPLLRVSLTSATWNARRLTPSVIVCTNALQMEEFGVKSVSYPRRDRLNVYVARSTSRLGFMWLMVRALFRSLPTARKFESIDIGQLSVSTRRTHMRVSLDGEIVDLTTPLNYRVRENGLRVLVPVRNNSGSS